MNKPFFNQCLLLLSALALNNQVAAELKPMNDTALEATVGQAYIVMDSTTDLTGKQFSRITFGQDVKVQANADSLMLGQDYNGGTDFSATNVSLGYIDTDTSTIVPFEFTNPYFEWVTDTGSVTPANKNNVVGFRVGAEGAKGKLQMDLSSFSGNIGMTINGLASSLYTGEGAGSSTQSNYRATMIGTNSGNCSDGTDCVSLANIQSLDVGKDDGSGGTDSTGDFFLSFQKEATNWLLSDGVSTQAATKGFFMNVPTNNNITISGTNSGTPGYAVEFIDRGIVGKNRWNNPI
jgi:hypothetical protein